MTESYRTLVSACFALACFLPARSDAQFPLTAESKINTAVPISAELEKLRKVVAGELTQKRFYEEEWKRRMSLRATTCSKGFTPSWHTPLPAVREKLTDLACFQKHDAETAQWIGYLRLGALAAKPALRPIPASVPETIAADAPIREAVFADAAGVAVLSTGQNALLVDLANGEILHRSTIPNGESLVTLSANGRLIGFESPNRDYTPFYSTETGEEIARIDTAPTFQTHWLGNECIFYGHERGKTIAIDLATGKAVDPFPFPLVTEVFPFPGEPNHFIIGTHRGVAKATTFRQDGKLVIGLLNERAVGMSGEWSKYTTYPTSDGAFISVPPPRHSSTLLSILNVRSLETENVDLGPGLRRRLVLGAGEPGKFLLRIGSRSDPKREERDYIYSIADKTLTPISPKVPGRAVMARSLKTVFGVSDGRLVQYRPVPTDDPPMSLEEFAAQNRARDAQDRLAAAEQAFGAPLPEAPRIEPPKSTEVVAEGNRTRVPQGKQTLTERVAEALRSEAPRPAPPSPPPRSIRLPDTENRTRDIQIDMENRIRDVQNQVALDQRAVMERRRQAEIRAGLYRGPESERSPIPPPLAGLAANARIEAVGVYEGERPRPVSGSAANANAPTRFSAPRVPPSPRAQPAPRPPGTQAPVRPSAPPAIGARTGGTQSPLPDSARPITPEDLARETHRQRPVPTVEVRIRRSDKPIVLVLSSYEAVQWKLTRESGANIVVILLGGYKESSVTGEGESRVLSIGRKYSYDMFGESFRQLDDEVFNWTGRHIDILQGRYRGSSFTVGGL